MEAQDCGCLTYETPDGFEDVASYDPKCPIHGWRWAWNGGPLSLEKAQEIDNERRWKASPVSA